MGRRKRQDKEGMAEECCFSCKDGSNDLRVCDFKNCLKAYHPACVGKGDAFLSSDEPFICDWHMCINCRGSSDYQCLCCPLYSVCCACLEKLEFVQLRKQKKGFCSMCLNRAILIEKNADADLAKTDHGDAEIGDILFKDYWEVIKDREHLALVDLEEASVFLNRKLNCKGVNSAKFSGADHNSDENILADNDANDQTITFDSKRKQDKVNTSLKNNKSNKKTYAGWASEELIAFLSSFGKDTTKPVDELEIVGLVKGYIKQKNLYRDNKKLSFLCDDKLQPLFTRRKVRCKMIRRFLSVHLASNAVSEDEIPYGSEDDDIPVIVKKSRNNLQLKIAKRVSERSKRCFASLIQKNINLIYLRRTLVVSLLSHPDTFEQKVVGCFVRLKNPLTVHTYQICTEEFQVGLVTGIKKSSEEYKINDTYTNVLLCVSGLWDDIQISMLSDEDFQEDECNGLISLVKKGLLKRATIAEFEEKVATVHADIVNHWFESELVRLEKNIDRAQIKGWRVELEELLRQKKLLSTPAERQRRLEELPEIVPDTEYEEKETELEVAASNSSQENKGAAQQVAISLKDLAEEPPKGAAADAVDCLKVLTEKPPEGERDQLTDSLNILNEESSEGATDQAVVPLNGLSGEPSKGATEQIPDSSNLLNKESSEVASKQGDATCEAPPEAHEACFSGGAPDPGLHSQMHSTQDDSPTQAMDIDRNGSDHTQQDDMTKFNEVEVINLDSDEDEDPPTVQHKPAGKSMHAPKAMNGGILDAEQSEPALPSPAAMNRDIHLEQHKPAPATMNGVLQPELRRPAPATMNGVLPPEQHKPAPAATNGVLHLAQCKPASAANNRVSHQAPLWHYVDPQGDTRGPFTLMHLWLWKQKGFFGEDFRVWRTEQTAEQAILLTDVFRMHL